MDTSNLVTRYKGAKQRIALKERYRQTIRDVATTRTKAVLHNVEIAPFGTVGVLDHWAGHLPRLPR